MNKLFSLLLILFSLILILNVPDVAAANSTTFSIDEVYNASSSVQTYVEINHKLPSNVTISGTTVSMPQFLKLESTSISNINKNITTEILLGSYNPPPSPSETLSSGNLTKTNYLSLATSVKSFMDSNGRAPNLQGISLGNMGYESLVYTFAEILNSYRVSQTLPNFIIVRPWKVVSNTSTVFITMAEINNAADTVQSYVETNHQLPVSVTISESAVNMAQFLKLEAIYLLNAADNLYQSIPLGKYGTASNSYETITGGNLESKDYLSSASDVKSFMDSNGRVPNFITSVRGSIGYESLVYLYAQIINSASKNQGLPSYITLVPWKTVANNNTLFLTMDQINTAVWTVKSCVEANHQLPGNVTVSGRLITMPQLLKLEITSLKNIYAGLYTSIILQNYDPAPNPSESITSGKINYENYMNVAENIKSFMESNGRAPNYELTSIGNLRFESLVYMYSQLLNYYNVNKALPQYITVNPWKVVTNSSTVTFNEDQVISGSQTVKSYIETNHKLPNNINISGITINIYQFLKLAVTTIHNINGDYTGQLLVGSYGPPTDTSETITGGILNKTDYLNLAKDVENFMYGNSRAPNYQNTTMGNIRFQSLVYMYSQILCSYKAKNNTLPDLVTIRPWSVVSNISTSFFNPDQIKNAAGTVKSLVETNHTIPNSVNISGSTVTMPQFLKLITIAVLMINGKFNATIILQDYKTAPSSSETVTAGNLNRTLYVTLAKNITSFMDSNGRAPNYQGTSLGNIRYESLVYMYSLILACYSKKNELPQNITITPWSSISNAKAAFFTVDQINDAAKTVQSYVESNHSLPINLTISGKQVTMPQFLQLETIALLNINNTLYTSIILGNYDTPPTPSENISSGGNLTKTNYLNLASDIVSFMYANGRAPNYKATDIGKIRFESMVYLYSQILSSHNATDALPKFVTINPWTMVSNSSTVFFTVDQIKTAAKTVKSYVDNNHQLPNSVNISGRTITMPQFLSLSVDSFINIENYLDTSVTLEDVGAPKNPAENITVGTIYDSEFVNMAKDIKSYMDSHGTAPDKVSNSGLGSSMRYESLIYMFSKVLISYNATEHPPDRVSIIPWLALSNPNGTFNFRTQKVFNSMQAAINDSETINGDTIWLEKSTYSENIVINKKVIIRPVSGFDVTIQALNPNLPVFTINSLGSDTTIRDISIKGSTGNAGIYINHCTNMNILGNNITGNSNGLYLYNSTDNLISGNKILNNLVNGVSINIGSDNEISGNELNSNGSEGIDIQNSNENAIYSNNIANNRDGIYLNSSSTKVHYNRIVKNSRYGLYNQGNGTVDATNNWWGSNNPTVSSTGPSDIYTTGGTVNYDPWLVLTMNSSADRSDRSGAYYNYLITADLTQNNQGNDTSSGGNLPDDVPINFITTMGTINSSSSTKKGRTELKLNTTAAGTADVSATLDKQTIHRTVNITGVNVLGIYNARTQESFATIQAAVDDVDTRDGDALTLADGIYTENVAIDKRLVLKPVDGANVTVKSQAPDKSVIIIVNTGSGTTIQGLNVIGAGSSYGFSLSHAYNCFISNNVITNSSRDVYLYLSGNNNITGNTIKNSVDGLSLYESSGNNISYNTITKNENGISLTNSNYNSITNNQIVNNYYGSYIYHSSNINVTGNNVISNWVGFYLYDTDNNCITGNRLTNNGAGITYNDSIGIILSGNSFSDNWLTDSSVIDSGEMIMATSVYTCGPAALATILKNLGIFTTEAELAQIAKTDQDGTSLLGLKNAAKSKGVNAFGYELSVGQLKPDYIVVLKINGYNHFDVVQNVTNETVTLFDPNLGLIQMDLSTFTKLYTGHAFVLNETIPGAMELTDDQMQDIKGLWHTIRTMKWRWHPGYWTTYTKVIDEEIPYPVVVWSYHHGWTIWTTLGATEVGGFWYPSGFRIEHYHLHYTIQVPYYVPGYPEPYAVYQREPDTWDVDYKKYALTFMTVGSGMILGADVIGAVIVRAAGTGITGIASGLTGTGIWAGINTIGGLVLSDLNYINPDPNPSGQGEPVINEINPSWEPYLAK